MKDQHQELLNLIKETDKSAKAALEHAHSNTELITDNSEKISNQDLQIEDMSNQITNFKTNLNELKSKLDDVKNRDLRKTLIFRNIPQTKNKESWNESKLTLAKEIKVIMPGVADDIIISNIERAHRAPQKDTNQYSTPGSLPIIAKFIDWNFSEKVKSNFIRAARDSFQQHPNQTIYISQMYSSSVTARRNKAMLKLKKLKRDERAIQAYVKCPAILMVKKCQVKDHTLPMQNLKFATHLKYLWTYSV